MKGGHLAAGIIGAVFIVAGLIVSGALAPKPTLGYQYCSTGSTCSSGEEGVCVSTYRCKSGCYTYDPTCSSNPGGGGASRTPTTGGTSPSSSGYTYCSTSSCPSSEQGKCTSTYRCTSGCYVYDPTCTSGTATSTPTTGTQTACTDSDGGSSSYYTRGTTAYSTGGAGSTDYCSGNTLTEFYCSGNSIQSTSVNCASLGNYTCSNGACVAASAAPAANNSCTNVTGPCYTQGKKTCTQHQGSCYNWTCGKDSNQCLVWQSDQGNTNATCDTNSGVCITSSTSTPKTCSSKYTCADYPSVGVGQCLNGWTCGTDGCLTYASDGVCPTTETPKQPANPPSGSTPGGQANTCNANADQLALIQKADTNKNGVIDYDEYWMVLYNTTRFSPNDDAQLQALKLAYDFNSQKALCTFAPGTSGTTPPSGGSTPPSGGSTTPECTTDPDCSSKGSGYTCVSGKCTAPSAPSGGTCDTLDKNVLKGADTNANGQIDTPERDAAQAANNGGTLSKADWDTIYYGYVYRCTFTPGSGTGSPAAPAGGSPGVSNPSGGNPPTGTVNKWLCTTSSTQGQCSKDGVTVIDTNPYDDPAKPGKVYVDGTNTSFSDQCLAGDPSKIQQYYLNPDSGSSGTSIIASRVADCPAGKACKDGACSQTAAAAGNFSVTAPSGGSFNVGGTLTTSWTGTIPGVTNVYIRLYKGAPPSASQVNWPNNPLFNFNSGNAVDIGKGTYSTTVPKNGDNGSALAAGTDYFIAVGYGGQLVAFSPNFAITVGGAPVTGPLKADFTCTYSQAFFATDGSVLPKTIQCTNSNPAAAYDWVVSGAAVADNPLNQASVTLRPTDNGSANILVVLRVFRNPDKSINDQNSDQATAFQLISVTRNVAPGTGPSQNAGSSGQAPNIQQFFVVDDQPNRLQYRSVSFIVQACDPNGAVLNNHIDYGDATTDDFAETSCLAVGRIHQYNQSGALTATLTAKSASGGQATQKLPITILANAAGSSATRRPPVINSFQVASSSSQVTGGLAMFSYDICSPDSSRLTLDFNYGDGQVDTGVPHVCGQGLRTHVYTQPGLYSATVTAQDGQGNRAGAAASISIQPAIQNQAALTAQFNWSPSNPDAGNTVVFYGGLSQSSAGTIVSYAWDFTASGAFSVVSPSPVATYAFSRGGSYPVRLRVTDNQSRTAEITRTVTVVGPASQTGALKAGDLVRTAVSDRIYQIVLRTDQNTHMKHWLPTAGVFLSYGFNWNDVKTLSPAVLDPVPRVKLVKLANSSTIYYITEPGRKRAIPNQAVFASYGNSFSEVFTINQTELDAYPLNTLIHLEHDPKIYLLENGQKRQFAAWRAFVSRGYQWSDVAPVNQTELDFYPAGSPIQ